MSAHKIQMQGIHTKESIQHSEHGGSLKSRNGPLFVGFLVCSGLAVLSGLMLRVPAAKRKAKQDKANLSKLQVGRLLLLS
jgi:hypothetical protein